MTRPASTHTVTVHVSGTIELPLDLSMLDSMQDPTLAQEILHECVKLSVAERLGYFDGMSISTEPLPTALSAAAATSAPSLSASGSPDYNADASRNGLQCRAELDLIRLGECVTAIQAAYNRVMAHAEGLRGMLIDVIGEEPVASHTVDHKATVAPSGEFAVESITEMVPPCGSRACAARRAAMLTILDGVLQGPSTVTEAAAAAEDTDVKKDGRGVSSADAIRARSPSSAGEEWNYRQEAQDGLEADPRAAGFRPLLQGDEETEEEKEEESSDDRESAQSMTAEDYARMGYTAL